MRAILTYHSIDPSGSVISVAEATFRRHMRFLVDSDIRVVPLERLSDSPDHEDAVAITFDDAFGNFVSRAWPILRDHEFTVTLFVVSGYTGASNTWDQGAHRDVPRLPLLDWDELARLADEGVTLASHSRSHPHLTMLPETALEEEIAGSASAIHTATGHYPTAFAYPFGDVDSRVARAVAETYTVACTVELRALGPDENPHLLPRLDSYYFRREGTLEAWGSASFRRRLWLWGQARSLRERITATREGGSRVRRAPDRTAR